MTDRHVSKKAEEWPLKAYKNLDFLTAPEGRIVRVLAEFMEPAARFGKHHVNNTIVFFGSSRTLPAQEAKVNLEAFEKRVSQKGRPPHSMLRLYEKAKADLAMSRYYEDAVQLAEKLTRWSLGIREKRKRFVI